MFAYQMWADTTAGVMKLRNGANSAWITLYELDGTFVTTDIQLGLGAAATPSLTFTGDLNTGVFSPGADQVSITTGGTERVRFDAAGQIEAVSLGTAAAPTYSFTTDPNTGIYSPGADQVSIATGGTQRAIVNASGNVGVNSASPNLTGFSGKTVTLDVGTGANGGYEIGKAGNLVAVFGVEAGTNDVRFGTTSSAALGLWANNQERARIDSSGRLLVGTSSDTESTTVVLQGNSGGGPTDAGLLRLCRGTSSPANGAALGYISFGDSGHGTAGFISCERDGGTWNTSTSRPSRLLFYTTADGSASPTERMRISNNGSVRIGGTTTINNERFLVVADGTFVGGTFYQPTTASYTAVGFNNPNGLVGSITTTGSSTSYATSSDYRLKENVEPIVGAAARILQLKPSRFNFLADPDHTVDGFIAHEAQEVVPECVTGTKDEVRVETYEVEPLVPPVLDEDGNEIEPGKPPVFGTREVPVYQGIDQSKLVPLLTAALQEAIGELQVLKAKVAALEAK
jgi:hypothetical protein